MNLVAPIHPTRFRATPVLGMDPGWIAGWLQVAMAVAVLMLPSLSFAGSPFLTGATALTANVLQILTPLAVIGVIAVGVAAWFNKVSWGWAVAAMIGIVLVFGAQQIVAWIRGMFGV